MSAADTVQSNISYAQTLDANIQTLSVNDADGSGVISGLLYVPDLDANEACEKTYYVPQNATTQEQLPATDFNLIALAPWHSVNCTFAYLRSAKYDPIRAFIFYLPDNGTKLPPPANDAVWDLGDGGKWKTTSHYPVYAVPGAIGAQFMQAISLYSGNVTSVPQGHELVELGIYPNEFVRVYTEIAVTNSTSLPSLWIFLLIVLGVLAIVLITTSLTLHLLQRARRKDLEKRVMRGQVNLEALGIKRLTVPMAIIEAMPLFVYTCYDQVQASTNDDKDDTRNSVETISPLADSEGSTSDPSTIYRIKEETTTLCTDHRYSSCTDSSLDLDALQPTCAICLEDYESAVSVIRELPCGHIFHPECIDTFLSENSSLCPMCKKSVFPLGYCPVAVTNGMARRERAVRRLRSRVTVTEGDFHDDVGRENRASKWRRILTRPLALQKPAEVELPMRLLAIDMDASVQSHAQLGRPLREAMSRQDVARARADLLVGGHADMGFDGWDGRSAWKRSFGKIFPL